MLAAGESKRFGEFKLLADLCGRPLIVRTVEAAIEARVGPVYAVVGYRAEDVTSALRAHGLSGVSIIYNPWYREGVSSSVKAAVFARPDLDGYIFALGDMPFVRPGTFRSLAERLGTAPIVAPAYRGRRGNPVLLSRGALGRIAALAGDVGVRALMGELEVSLVEVEDEGVVRDVDEPEDLPECGRTWAIWWA